MRKDEKLIGAADFKRKGGLVKLESTLLPMTQLMRNILIIAFFLFMMFLLGIYLNWVFYYMEGV